MTNIQQEIWKDVKDFEGYYQISNLGRVKSLKRIVPRSDNKIRTIFERILANSFDKDGYARVCLSKNGKLKHFRINILVGLAFLGIPDFENGYIFDHKNNIKTDNRVFNLQIISTRENTSKDKFRLHTSSKYVGVSLEKSSKKWVANIRINGKATKIGRFANEYDAHLAYQNKLKSIS